MILWYTIIGVVFLLGLILLITTLIQKSTFGALQNERVYQDTGSFHGKTLYAKTINLIGRPDYIIKEQKQFIPVEIKTGKTPAYPYKNHIMQLMAYCLLVEETYSIKPSFGYIKYPEREFRVLYTNELKAELIQLVEKITANTISNVEQFCNHREHNEFLRSS